MKLLSKNKVIADEAKINEFLTRSIEKVYPDIDTLKKALLSGKKLSFYLGIDPTGPSIHLGHMIPLLTVSRLQNLGHQVIILLGDFTAMIGDPSDKSSVRKQLTKKEVLLNLKDYKKQLSKIINFSGGNKAKIAMNSKWLSKLKFADVVELASKVTVQQMLERDMFEKRVKEGKPVYLHEFMYPLMQGYDSVALKVDGEIGGNDQTFNMLMGRDLAKNISSKDKFVLTTKLLADATGKKMGKSEGNMVSLADSPNEVFGKVMSWSDGMIVPALEYCTVVPLEEVRASEKRISDGNNPMAEKKLLASAIVSLCFGEKEAALAEESFGKAFSKKEVPDEIPEIILSLQDDLPTLLISKGFISSRTELRRLASNGAITELTTGKKINQQEILTIRSGTLRIGQHRFVKIISK